MDTTPQSLERPASSVLPSEGAAREGRRAAYAAVIGSVIEYYDFALYGAASALVFGPLFFPEVSATAGVLASFSTFAVGFLARPIGAMAVAHFGDRIGRKPGLLFSMVLMGIATVLVGLLPTYETAGVLAPVLLVVLRFCQGLGSGAELAGAFTYIIEHHRGGRPTFFSSLIASASQVGLTVASLTFLAVSAMPRDVLLGGGWRIPFLASVVIFAVAIFLRTRVAESPGFLEEREAAAARPLRVPLVDLVRNRPVQLVAGILSLFCLLGFSLIGNAFMLSYLQNTVGMSSSAALTAGLASTVLGIVGAPLFGLLGDRIGSIPVLAGGTAFVAVTAFPFFALARTGIVPLVVVSFALWYAIGWSAMASVHGVYAARLYETRYRFTGLAVTREIPSALVGGTAPLVASALVSLDGGQPWLVAWYVVALSVVSLLAIAVVTVRGRRRPQFLVEL